MAIHRRGRLVLGLASALALLGALVPLNSQAADPDAAAIALLRQDQAKHFSLLGLDRWQSLGYRGQGIKIAVLDTGFRGYREQLGKTLPAQIETHCFRSDGNFEAKNSQHGLLCAEVLHTLAPQADLLLATWEPDSSESFLDGVRWAKQAGARIISCSIIMPSWSDGNGGGEFHQKLRRILAGHHPSDLSFSARGMKRGIADEPAGSGQTLFFACAGNTALRHWTGSFQAGADGFHEWERGQTANSVKPWGRERVSVELYGSTNTRYEITVRDERGQEVSRSRPFPYNSSSIAARFIPLPQSTYYAQVRPLQGQPGKFHLVVLGGTLGTVTSRGSVACPADGPEVIAVGAMTPQGRRLEYSACGLDSQMLKPDFVAPVPFPITLRSQSFTGTSAAAPQAAALAAVLWSHHPNWTAEEIHAALIKSSRDVGLPGPDCETGHGMIALPEAP